MALKDMMKSEAGKDIRRRCRRAQAAISSYQQAYPDGPELRDDAIWIDLLFDLRHLADKYEVDFDAADRMAQRHYTSTLDGSFYYGRSRARAGEASNRRPHEMEKRGGRTGDQGRTE